MHFVPLGQNIATTNFEWRLSIVTKLEFALEVGNFQDRYSKRKQKEVEKEFNGARRECNILII